MILDFHPDIGPVTADTPPSLAQRYLSKLLSKPFKFIGYWTARSNPDIDSYGRRLGALAAALPLPSDYVDPEWDANERALVLAYVKSGTTWESWRGFSWCRFGCDHKHAGQGSRDITDGTYVWPEGFSHYIEKHAVKPPQEFIEHALLNQMTRG